MPSNDQKLEHLDDLLKQHNHLAGKLWKGSQKPKTYQTSQPILRTGFTELDQQLHSGGWPLNTTTEIGLERAGIGELRLLIPALRELQKSSQQKNILFIAPPFLPYAPSLLKEHIDVSKLTIVNTKSVSDAVWATEQALLAECCAAVLCWTQAHKLSTPVLRRLQLAAEKTQTWNVLLRHSSCLQQPSASGLRIQISSTIHSELDLHITKQPQGWGDQRCTLSLSPHYQHWQRLDVNLWPNTQRHSKQFKPANKENTKAAKVTMLMPLSILGSVH